MEKTDSRGDTMNCASARFDGGTITGDNTSTADLSVVAYNHTMIGTGGGSLTVGGKTGIGGAVTYADIRNDVEAKITGGATISQFQTASVRAINATEIGGVA